MFSFTRAFDIWREGKQRKAGKSRTHMHRRRARRIATVCQPRTKPLCTPRGLPTCCASAPHRHPPLPLPALSARSSYHDGCDCFEELDSVILGADILVDLGRGIVAVHKPVERISNELEIRCSEVLHADETRVAQCLHRLGEVCTREGKERRRERETAGGVSGGNRRERSHRADSNARVRATRPSESPWQRQQCPSQPPPISRQRQRRRRQRQRSETIAVSAPLAAVCVCTHFSAPGTTWRREQLQGGRERGKTAAASANIRGGRAEAEKREQWSAGFGFLFFRF